MIYSVDTCVLLDILLPDPVHGIPSREVLKKASENGKLAVCSIVYNEELEEQTQLLQQSEEKLKVQQILSQKTRKFLRLCARYFGCGYAALGVPPCSIV